MMKATNSITSLRSCKLAENYLNALNIGALVLAGISLAFSSSLLAADEEYEYVKTPDAFQIADLLDDDKDGVVNARDACADTIRGSEVNNDGCGEIRREQDVRKMNILFDNDSYEINPVFSNQIREMADFLDTYLSTSIEIQGYASSIGSEAHNLELSKQRAIAVEKKLLEFDIDPSRVRVVGFGENPDIDDSKDLALQATQRKVTATVVGLKEEVIEEWTIFTIIEK